MKKLILFLILIFLYWSAKKQQPEEVSLNANDAQTLDNLLIFHNLERERLDLPELQLDFNLISYAQNHAEWMSRKNSLTHSNLKNVIWFQRSGENIAWNQADEQAVLSAWMNSQGHRNNILNRKFSHVGFGVARNSKNQIYWCTVFGG